MPGSFLQDAFPGAQYPLAVQVLVEVNGKLHAPVRGQGGEGERRAGGAWNHKGMVESRFC